MTASKDSSHKPINIPSNSRGPSIARIVQFFWCTAFFVGYLGVLYAYTMKQPLGELIAGAGNGKVLPGEYLFQVQFPELEVLMDKRAFDDEEKEEEDDNDNETDENEEIESEDDDEDFEKSKVLNHTPEAVAKFQDILPRREVLVIYYNRFCTADYNTSWLSEHPGFVTDYASISSPLVNTSAALPIDYSTLECHSFVRNDGSNKISILEPLLDDFATAVRETSNQDEDDLAAASSIVDFVYRAGVQLDESLCKNRVYVSLYAALAASMFFVNSFVFVLTPLFVRKHVIGSSLSHTPVPLSNPATRSHAFIVGATIYTALFLAGLVIPGVMGVLLSLGYGTAAPSARAAARVVASLIVAARASEFPEIVNLAQYYSRVKVVSGDMAEASVRETFANLNRVGMFSIVFSVICGYLFLKPVDEEEEVQQRGPKTQSHESFEV